MSTSFIVSVFLFIGPVALCPRIPVLLWTYNPILSSPYLYKPETFWTSFKHSSLPLPLAHSPQWTSNSPTKEEKGTRINCFRNSFFTNLIFWDLSFLIYFSFSHLISVLKHHSFLFIPIEVNCSRSITSISPKSWLGFHCSSPHTGQQHTL